jgi:urease accessory protein
MRSRAELVASAPLAERSSRGWRLTWARAAAPLAFRETQGALYIVGTAASPADDDEVSLSVRVEPGAKLVVRSAASSIAWAGRGSSLELTVELEEGACLDWQLQPLVATSRCDFYQHSSIHLAAGASLRWGEEIVLGRSGEGPGALRLRLDADIGGRPLLRHELAVGPGSLGWDGPAVLGDHRAAGLVFLAGQYFDADGSCTALAGPQAHGADAAWATMPLDAGAVVVQATGTDLPALREALCQAMSSSSSSERQRAPA